MAPIAQQIASMVEMLPEADQALAYTLVKKLVLAWDPDYTSRRPVKWKQSHGPRRRWTLGNM